MFNFNIYLKTILILSLSFYLNSCAKYNFAYDMPIVMTPIKLGGINDEREYFYNIFCQKVQGNCEDYLFYNDLKVIDKKKISPEVNQKFKIIIIPGIFGECLGDEVLPFMFAIPKLEEEYPHISISVIKKLNGRASSRHNAIVIKQFLENITLEKNEKLILLSYSKGSTDTLFFLEEYYKGVPEISGLISISGVINGTPVADMVEVLADRIAKNIPITNCPVIDSSGVPSLTMNNQLKWLSISKRAFNYDIDMFSLVTVSKPENTSTIFELTYDILNNELGANDGQVPAVSQVLPYSNLLGYLNADHWAVILPFEEVPTKNLNQTNRLIKTVANKNTYPRTALLESLIIYLNGFYQKN